MITVAKGEIKAKSSRSVARVLKQIFSISVFDVTLALWREFTLTFLSEFVTCFFKKWLWKASGAFPEFSLSQRTQGVLLSCSHTGLRRFLSSSCTISCQVHRTHARTHTNTHTGLCRDLTSSAGPELLVSGFQQTGSVSDSSFSLFDESVMIYLILSTNKSLICGV